MSVLPAFDLVRAATLDDALDAIGEGAVPYAGGTELLLAMRAGLLRPEALVDLKRVEELGAIEVDGSGFRIGGGVTHAAAIQHPGLRSEIPILGEVLLRVGNPRVRATGTLGGNLCFGEPKSDVATLLIALDATVTLASRRGTRSLPVSEFCVGPYTTALEEDELLSWIHLAACPHPVVYEKFQTMERPTVGVAAAGRGDGSVKMVVGAVGPVPQSFELEAIDAVDPAEVAEQVEVIPDLTGSERYKRHVTAKTVERVMNRLKEAL